MQGFFFSETCFPGKCTSTTCIQYRLYRKFRCVLFLVKIQVSAPKLPKIKHHRKFLLLQYPASTATCTRQLLIPVPQETSENTVYELEIMESIIPIPVMM